MDPEVLRLAVRAIKRRFVGWREPPVDLPPDSVIEDAVREVEQSLVDDTVTVAMERDRFKSALDKINAVRNSIIALQTFNWSEHAYPLVATLDEAGVEGEPYPGNREYLGSIIDQRDGAITECDRLRATLAESEANHLAATQAYARLLDETDKLRVRLVEQGNALADAKWTVMP